MLRLILTFSIVLATPLWADGPDIVDARASKSGQSWRFDVTVAHPDTGWDHYADGWRVLDADGNVLGHRTLHHPHETEQPFTRSLSGVNIPQGIREVFIQPHCNVTGWGDETFLVKLP